MEAPQFKATTKWHKERKNYARGVIVHTMITIIMP